MRKRITFDLKIKKGHSIGLIYLDVCTLLGFNCCTTNVVNMSIEFYKKYDRDRIALIIMDS